MTNSFRLWRTYVAPGNTTLPGKYPIEDFSFGLTSAFNLLYFYICMLFNDFMKGWDYEENNNTNNSVGSNGRPGWL